MQRQLPAALSVEVSYVARRGYNNQRKRNINQLPPGTIQANPGINPNALRPFRGMGIIGLAENTGRTEYDALQISANRRLSAGLQFGLGYTFSRNLDNGSGEIELLPNAYDDSGYWGRSDLDRPHVLVANAIYELPAPPGPRLIKAVLGGWSVGGHLPGTVRRAVLRPPERGLRRHRARQRRSVLESDRGSQSGHADRVHRFGGVVQSGRIRATRSGTFGVQPRNGLRQPGFWEWNLSVLRRFRLMNHHSFDFRWEAFNVLNHPDARRSQQQSDQRVVWAGDQQDGQPHHAVRRAVSLLGLASRLVKE